jgi:hypothetical protein
MPLTSIRQRPCHSARWQSSHDIPDRLHRAPEKWTYFLTLRSMHSSIYRSTLTRLITGHAFTGAYRIKFRHKNLPPATEEEVACACGAVPEDTEHVLLHCPLTHEQRLRHLSTDGLPDSLRKLFDSPGRCLGLLRFLEETRVCAKPRNAWEPG